MPEIEVEGLGRVEIQGDTPSPEEERAIIEGLRGSRAQIAPRRTEAATRRAQVDPPIAQPRFQGSELERLTGGFVNRNAAIALGGTVGGALGAGAGGVAGVAGGPAAPATIPGGAALGGVAGATLGTAAGGLAFDVAEDVTRSVTGREPVKRTFAGQSKKALKDAEEELLFTGGVTALGPVFRAFKPLIGKALGVGKARALADAAAGQRIPLGLIQASKNRGVKGVSRVVGVFPFVGTPFRKGAQASTTAVRNRFDEVLNELAPNATIADTGVDLARAAKGRFKKFRSVAGALYDRFGKLAENASTKEIFPTDDLVEVAKTRSAAQQAGEITLKSGGRLAPPTGAANPVTEFLESATDLPENITIQQARQLQRDLQEAMTVGTRDGFDITRLIDAKKALERGINNPRVDLLPEGEATALVDSLTKANAFFAENIKRFETATAKRFGRVNRNIFGPNVFKAGSLNEDEIFSAVFNSKSPQAVADLKSLVGKNTFQKATRRFLQTAFDSANGASFDPGRFSAKLGLDTEEGVQAVTKMLEGTGVNLKQLRSFIEVAEAAGSFVVPDSAVFLQRRFTLTGLKGILGGVLIGGAAVGSPVKVGAAVLLTRQVGKILTDPEQLRLMTRVLSDTTTDQQARAMLLRLGRLALDDEDETPEVLN